MGTEDEDDIDVEAILARAAATREKAADIDALMEEAAAKREAKSRETLVPAPVDLLAEAPEAPEVELPEPVPLRDPFAEVAAVLAKAREARGLPPEEPEAPKVFLPEALPPRDPMAAAEAALVKAKEARAPRSTNKKVEQALAEAKLRKMKRAAAEATEE